MPTASKASAKAQNAAIYGHLADDFLAFTIYMFSQVEGMKFDAAPHIVEIAEGLSRMTRDPNHRRLILTAPPRHGKSTLASMYWVAWMLGRNPNLRFGVASYGGELSKQASYTIKKIIEHPSYARIFPGTKLAQDASAIELWHIEGARGYFKVCSVGGAITGFGFDYLLFDDPHKGYEDAASETMRDAIWNWFISDATTRLDPFGEQGMIVLHTRFHPDDLIGRLLEKQRTGDEYADQWDQIVLPAIDMTGVESDSYRDGRPLWRPLDFYLRESSNRGPFVFSAMFQGDPIVSLGEFFQKDMFKVEDRWPVFRARYRHYDLAVSIKKKADSSASALVAIDDHGDVWILDVWRDKKMFPQTVDHIAKVAATEPDVQISLPMDVIGTSLYDVLAPTLNSRLVKYPEKQNGNKEQRASVWQSRGFDGDKPVARIHLAKGDWNDAFIKEAMAFPNGAHDDMIDAVSGAYFWALRGNQGVLIDAKPDLNPWSQANLDKIRGAIEDDF